MIQTKIYQPTEAAIAHAAKLLLEGQVVGIPTETVYGLAANIYDEAAVYRIFETKHRPADNPLIVHIAEFDQMIPVVKEVSPLAKKLAEKFWPGPLTIVQPKSDTVCDAVTAGMDTVGVRMPAHPVARALIQAAGVPLAAPSANLSGIPSPTSAEHVYDDLNGSIECILDGGECEVGVESTVVRVDEDGLTLLRPGGITVEQLQTVCEKVTIAKGVLEHLEDHEKVQSPGMKYRHYAPKVPVVILDGSYEQFAAYVKKMSRLHDVGAMVFSGEGEGLTVPVIEYGRSENGKSEATGLFSALRQVDTLEKEVVFARMPAKDGVGFAVYNRLLRAASFLVLDLNAPKRIPVVGLTGQTGAGKSVISEGLAEIDCYPIDCDKLARKAVEAGTDTLKKLTEAFGEEILQEDGSLNRRALGGIVFSDPQKLGQLNAITHPAILTLIEDEILYAASLGHKAAVVDAPTLFESGADRLCDTVIAVTAAEQTRLNRIMKRDGLTEQTAKQRIAAQHLTTFYQERSELVIENDGGKQAAVEKAVAFLVKKGWLPKERF